MKQTTSIMRHGADAYGNIVSIDNVVSGASCGLSCMSCGRPLLARKGEKNVHSFAHQAEITDKEIRKCHESYAHFFAKNSLVTQGFVSLPEGLGRCYINENYLDELKITRGLIPRERLPPEPMTPLWGYGKVRFEVIGWAIEPFDVNHRIRPDAKIKCSYKSIDFELNVEIFYSHKVDGDKRKKIVEGNINCVEINISAVDYSRLESSILENINDTDNVSVIHFDDDLARHCLPQVNVDTFSYSRAIEKYTEMCVEMTSREGVYLPVDLIYPTFYKNHKGDHVYHRDHNESGWLYKCKGGGDGLLIFENENGNEVKVSFIREANSSADLVCKKTCSARRGVDFPDFLNLSGRMRAGHKHNIAAKGLELRNWLLDSAFRELEAYCDALLKKLVAFGLTCDGIEVRTISSGVVFAEVSENFISYYGEDLVLQFLLGLDAENSIKKNYGSVLRCFESNYSFKEKWQRAKVLEEHVSKSFYNISTNFDRAGHKIDSNHRFFGIRSIVECLTPYRLDIQSCEQ